MQTFTFDLSDQSFQAGSSRCLFLFVFALELLCLTATIYFNSVLLPFVSILIPVSSLLSLISFLMNLVLCLVSLSLFFLF